MSAHRQSLGLAGASQGVSRGRVEDPFSFFPFTFTAIILAKLLVWRTEELLIPEVAARRKTVCIYYSSWAYLCYKGCLAQLQIELSVLSSFAKSGGPHC